ncbi:MAG: DUF4112 domain-containing protein [Acidobacteriota bacterium]|nr:DUF4112 domain-containing protein [Acidobacteriota bacterium]
MSGLQTMKAYQEEEKKRASQLLDQTRSVKIDESLERLSWVMDDLIRVPGLGWRFGLDAIIGLIPGFGDTATSLVSFYILASAVRYRVPKVTLLRMGLNIGIDYLVGSLPLVGDLFDAWWKSNQKNVALLRKRATVAADAAREGTLSDWLFVGLIIVLLVCLALGAAIVSVYLVFLIVRQFSQALPH